MRGVRRVEVDLVRPRRVARLASRGEAVVSRRTDVILVSSRVGTRPRQSAVVVIRPVVQAGIRGRLEAEAAGRSARADDRGGTETPFRRHLVVAERLQLVLAVVGQAAIGAHYQLRQVPVLGLRHVGLATRTGVVAENSVTNIVLTEETTSV